MKVAVDIGGSGALARIEKGRKIMKDSRTEWSSVDELPVRPFWIGGLIYQRLSFVSHPDGAYRSRSRFRLSTVITRSSLVPYPKSKRRKAILR
jgi:hypothetical protein